MMGACVALPAVVRMRAIRKRSVVAGDHAHGIDQRPGTQGCFLKAANLVELPTISSPEHAGVAVAPSAPF